MANDLISHDYIMRPPYKLKTKQGLEASGLVNMWRLGKVTLMESPSPFPYLALGIFYLAVPKL